MCTGVLLVRRAERFSAAQTPKALVEPVPEVREQGVNGEAELRKAGDRQERRPLVKQARAEG